MPQAKRWLLTVGPPQVRPVNLPRSGIIKGERVDVTHAVGVIIPSKGNGNPTPGGRNFSCIFSCINTIICCPRV